jgi:hypothetical protein
LPSLLLPSGADGGNPTASLTTELGDVEQLLQLRLYHQGLPGLREEKAVDGAAELVSLVTHALDHLLCGRL